MNTHTYTRHTHTVFQYTAGKNSQTWLCAGLIHLTVSEMHVNQPRRLPVQTYMSPSFSPMSWSLSFYLHLFSPICLCSSQNSTSLYLSHIPSLLLLLFLLQLSSHHNKSCLSLCFYILMHPYPPVKLMETLKAGPFI